MSTLRNKKYFIDCLGLLSIGIISWGYVVFVKGLAEQHIQLPFLNFPIFVGEILLFICLVLFLVKYSQDILLFTKWHYILLGYFIFVLLKAVYGYDHWGPLAFRHAALFYYPAFAIFGYAFFRREFFGRGQSVILLVLIAGTFMVRHYEYTTLTLTILGIILIQLHWRGWIRYGMVLALLSIIPYKEFFSTARMMIVGNFVSGLYLAWALPIIFKIERRLKWALTILIGGVVLMGLLKFADHRAIKSIVNFQKMAEVIQSSDVYINAHQDHFKMEEYKQVKLYNPDQMVMNVAQNQELKQVNVAQNQELKQVIVEHVQAKIMNFVFAPFEEKTQESLLQEIRQEAKLILDRQLHQVDLPAPPGPIEIRASQPKVDSQVVIVQPREILQQTDHKYQLLYPPDVSPGAELSAQVQDVAQQKAGLRQIFFERVRGEIERIPIEELRHGDTQFNTRALDEIKKEIQMAFTQEIEQQAPDITQKKDLTGWVDNNNAVFRILIWRDMLRNLKKEKPIFGFDFGDPFRSKSLEILDWGRGDWARDGWIEPHNSYLHIIYRAGIVGILLIFSFLFILFKMILYSLRIKSFAGILLCGIIINWFTAANFLVTFELPYTAIPIWTIYGITFAYCYKTRGIEGQEHLATTSSLSKKVEIPVRDNGSSFSKCSVKTVQ